MMDVCRKMRLCGLFMFLLIEVLLFGLFVLVCIVLVCVFCLVMGERCCGMLMVWLVLRCR